MLDGIAALWRLRMANADQFGLRPQSAATLDAVLCTQIKSCLPFSNSNPQFKPSDIIMSAIAADNLSKVGLKLGLRLRSDSKRANDLDCRCAHC
jgi:hypothetical protein